MNRIEVCTDQSQKTSNVFNFPTIHKLFPCLADEHLEILVLGSLGVLENKHSTVN